jgi:5-methylcytosine-specific restriction endonuclease McrA
MRNGGKWTEARWVSFVKGVLRAGSNKWPPKWECKRAARTERGVYKCEGFARSRHTVPASIVVKGKRQNNIFVDHVAPIVGGNGFTSWDDFIEGLYCEVDNLQVLCKECHDAKSKAERTLRKKVN